jgi:hypothetical protein
MVTTVKQPVQITPTDITPAGFGTLVSSGFASTVTKDNTVNQPSDLLVEMSATASGTPTNGQQVILYAQSSLDGTNWTTGPINGTTTTDEIQLKYVGAVILNNPSTIQRQHFPVAIIFGGILPPYIRFIVKNDTGVTLSQGQLRVSEVSNTAA